MKKPKLTRREFLKTSGVVGASAFLPKLGKDTFAVPAISTGKPLEVKLWHMETPPNRIETLQGVIDDFNTANPEILVSQETINWGEAYAKIPAAIQAGNQPDLQFATPDLLHTLLPLGAVQPLNDVYSDVNPDVNFFDNAVDPFRYEENLWGIPLFMLTHLLVYRMDLLGKVGFSNAPESWEEWAQAAKALTGDGKYALTLPASNHLYTEQCITDFMVTNKADIFAADGSLNFNSPETIEAFTFYKEMYQYSPPDAPSMTWPEANASFLTGQSAMTLIFGAIFARLPSESPDFADQVASAAVPIPPDGEKKVVGSDNGVIMLTDDSEKQEACKKFIEHLVQPDYHAAWTAAMQAGLYMPVSEAEASSDAYWEVDILNQYREHMELAFEMSENVVLFGFNHDEVQPKIAPIAGELVLSQVVQKVVIDEMDPEEAVAWGHEKMEELIS